MQAWQLPLLCVWAAGLFLDLQSGKPACSSIVLLQVQAEGTLAQLNRERPVGKVLSLGAGLWISLLLVVLQPTFSSLALHQSSFLFRGSEEAAVFACFRSLTRLWQIPSVM